MTRVGILCVLFCSVLVAGCSTPAARIGRNRETFEAFPSNVQENVRLGRIEMGYSRDMVYIALGQPRRVYDRQSEETTTEIWAYTGLRYGGGFHHPVDTAHVFRDAEGEVHFVYGITWVTVDDRVEFETLRVEFEDDKVVAIENLRR